MDWEKGIEEIVDRKTRDLRDTIKAQGQEIAFLKAELAKSKRPEYVPASEAARLLGYSVSTVYRKKEEGKLEYMNVGSRLYIRIPDGVGA